MIWQRKCLHRLWVVLNHGELEKCTRVLGIYGIGSTEQTDDKQKEVVEGFAKRRQEYARGAHCGSALSYLLSQVVTRHAGSIQRHL